MTAATPLSQTARAYSDDEFTALIARLSVSNREEVPRTPSPRRRPAQPSPRESIPPPSSSDALYYYHSPTAEGYTRSWATAGAATQGVPGATVYAVQHKSKKRGFKKAAFVIYAGRDTGVVHSWAEAHRLVNRVSCAIYRGYRTVREAEAAYAYAQARCWTRICTSRPSSPSQPSLASLPSPSQPSDMPNPLHGDEPLDDTWFVVYRGITPGVYHSLLEALLNTLGVRNSLYEAIVGRSKAFATFHAVAIIDSLRTSIMSESIDQLQNGERCNNVDFIFSSALANTMPIHLCSYDWACPFRHYRIDPITKQRVYFTTDGEGAERAWATLNPLRANSREMQAGHRQDSLLDALESFNLAKQSVEKEGDANKSSAPQEHMQAQRKQSSTPHSQGGSGRHTGNFMRFCGRSTYPGDERKESGVEALDDGESSCETGRLRGEVIGVEGRLLSLSGEDARSGEDERDRSSSSSEPDLDTERDSAALTASSSLASESESSLWLCPTSAVKTDCEGAALAVGAALSSLVSDSELKTDREGAGLAGRRAGAASSSLVSDSELKTFREGAGLAGRRAGAASSSLVSDSELKTDREGAGLAGRRAGAASSSLVSNSELKTFREGAGRAGARDRRCLNTLRPRGVAPSLDRIDFL
ncbi:hypothetical protein C8R43DRAFT_942295 [Mycena crocata]|nr:hypothetical protein C8R43DRAFT_942295 [Mycena crocata]